jgi:hypothetical protein
LRGLRRFCLYSWQMRFCKAFGCCWGSVGCRKRSRHEIRIAMKDVGLLAWEGMLRHLNGMMMSGTVSELQKKTVG